MPDAGAFNYQLAFDRNLGLLTDWEQQALRGKKIAIAGMGGVGGFHLLTLARLGIGNFHIADFDRFGVENFNRQVGATIETLGRPKVDVMAEMALSINPELGITRFPAGIDGDNLDAFLHGVDLFVDGLDFFVLDIRRRMFARCAELGIPAITAAPLGMGAGFLAFLPGGMSFEEYFRFEGRGETQQYVRFLMGLSPRGLHRPYVVDPSRIDLRNRRGPSTVAGVELCAGVAGVAAVKLLLGRGGIRAAPYHHHFDAYRGKLVVTRLGWGNAGPVQRLKLAIGDRIYGAMARQAASTPAPPTPRRPASRLEEILNIARWAPSGDNVQSWRFRILGEDTIEIRLKDSSDENVYEYREAEPSLLAGGMLLECLRIAATAFGSGMSWRYEGHSDRDYRITARFPVDLSAKADPLYSYLTLRSTNRYPYRLKALGPQAKAALTEALGQELRIDWWESATDRWRWAGLSAAATDIRLRMREAFSVHQRMIDWDRSFSPTGIPAKAVGLNLPSRMAMRWAMKSWERMRFLNRLGGTASAALQLDYLPGVFSAGYFAIRDPSVPQNGTDRAERLLQCGGRILRFWLSATRLGLTMQPALAILGLAHYGATGRMFTSDPALRSKAANLAGRLRAVTGSEPDGLLFVGRIGYRQPQITKVRSVRLPFEELIETGAPV
ncbi:MAG TPA: ThiF family adenylyltransferase [Alphaproteobacteria bacterium]|nr:ThiF family adenylyltransferase [Alphaproteobacteria bacterium]